MGFTKLINSCKETNVKNHIKTFLIVFLCIQPLLEIILNVFSDDSFSIAGISIATLIRYALIAVIVIATIVVTFKRKITWIFIGYLMVTAVYIILQWFNLRNFNVTVMDVNLQKSLAQTVLFVARYAMPICLLYEVYVLHFNLEDFKKTVISISLFISVSMILSNILGIDSISYSFGSTLKPEGSIISWFGNKFDLNWKMFTSRGLFRSGNQLSSLQVLLLPSVLWISLNSKKLWCFMVSLAHLVTMLMLGTRVAVYGTILISAGVVIVYSLNLIFNRKKFDKRSFACLISVFCIFTIVFVRSPFVYRMGSGQAGILNGEAPPSNVITSIPSNNSSSGKNESDSSENESDSSENDTSIPEYIAESMAQTHWIPIDIISEYYKYEDHKEFWDYVINEVEFTKRDNAREVKVLVLQDIFSKKGGKLDDLVGIGEVPIYPEKDFVAQKYYIGIIGMLLFIVPYLIIIIWFGIVSMIRLFKKKFDGIQYVLLMSGVFICCVAYVAGHTLEPLLVNTYIGMICGVMLLQLANMQKTRNEE